VYSSLAIKKKKKRRNENKKKGEERRVVNMSEKEKLEKPSSFYFCS
jgi:hypothetical protein